MIEVWTCAHIYVDTISTITIVIFAQDFNIFQQKTQIWWPLEKTYAQPWQVLYKHKLYTSSYSSTCLDFICASFMWSL